MNGIMAGLPCFSPGLLGAIDFNWGGVAVSIVSNLILCGITWLIAVRVTVAKLEERSSGLLAAIQAIRTSADAHAVRMDALSRDLHGCQTSHAREGATKGDFAAVAGAVADSANRMADRVEKLGDSFRSSVSKAHCRIDEVVRDVARMEAEVGNLKERVA